MDQKLPDNYPWKYFQPNMKENTGINLLKLHGSVDIFGYDDLKSYLCILPSGSGIDGYLNPLRLLNDGNQVGPPRILNEVLAHDDTGQLQILRRSILSGVYKFTKRIGQVVPEKTLPLFQGSLNFAHELIIIGYGFWDLHINQIVRDWLESTEERNLVIVNPTIEQIPSFVAHLPTQVTIVKKSTMDYLSSLPGGELTNEERENHDFRNSLPGLSEEEARRSILSKLILQRVESLLPKIH